MSLNSEITRIETAKATLKTKLNARNDNQHQIDDETIDEYGDFVDSIPQGGGIDWSEIGYSEEPQSVTDGFDYAKTIYDNWDSTRTNYNTKFSMDSNLKYMPLVDTSNGTTFRGTFQFCANLENVPQLNTSNGTDFSSMFFYCSKLKNVPQIDTSNGTNFASMFYQCTSLKYIPFIDTSNGTIFANMLSYCSGLTSIPQLNTSNGSNFANMFMQSSPLQTIPQLNFEKAINVNNMFGSCSRLTTVGGFLNLGQAYDTAQSANYSDYKLILSSSTSLTHDSLMNVINGLYDIATKGCNAQQLILGATNLAKLTAEEIAIATNKGFSVS